jgi:hypothetical protein
MHTLTVERCAWAAGYTKHYLPCQVTGIEGTVSKWLPCHPFIRLRWSGGVLPGQSSHLVLVDVADTGQLCYILSATFIERHC